MNRSMMYRLTLAAAIVLLAGVLGWSLGIRTPAALAAPLDPGGVVQSLPGCESFHPPFVCDPPGGEETCIHDPGSRIVTLPLWSANPEGAPDGDDFTVSVAVTIGACVEEPVGSAFRGEVTELLGFWVHEGGESQYFNGWFAHLPYYPDAIEPVVVMPCNPGWGVQADIEICAGSHPE